MLSTERVHSFISAKFWFRIVLSLVSGLLLAVAWPPSSLNFIVLFSFVPLLFSFFLSPSWKEALLHSYTAFFIFSAVSMSWFKDISDEGLALFLIYLTYLLLPLVQSMPWLLAYWIKTKNGVIPGLLCLPFFYLSYEMFHYFWDLSYTWLHLGLAFSNAPYFLKIYPYIGQEGGTLLILFVNVLLVLLTINTGNKTKQVIEFTALLILLTIPAVISPFKGNPKSSIQIGIFQPDLPFDEKMEDKSIENHFERLSKATAHLSPGELDLLLCPEGYFKNFHNHPIILNDPHRHHIIQKLKNLAAEKELAILTGMVGIKLYFTNKGPTITARKKKDQLFYDTYNGVMLIEPDGDIQWRSKVKLVPFAERVPFLKYIQSLEAFHLDFNESYGSYDKEENPRPFLFKSMRIAPLVCYESLFPNVTSLFVLRKSNILMEFSNENWTPEVNKGQLQHEQYANVNVAQFGRNYLRSTFKNGSAIYTLDSRGIETYSGDDSILIKEVELLDGLTFYAEHRSWYLFVSWLSLPLILMNLLIQKLNKRT